MTTTFPAPAPLSTAAPVVPSPRRSAPTSAPGRAPSGCAVERRALGSAVGDLAAALTGIAFDEPCRPERQRAIVAFSAGTLQALQGVATRSGEVALHRALAGVTAATPLFAACISSGAPGLAGAWTAVAELLGEEPGHDHAGAELLACERRFRALGVRAAFAVPMFADACSPRERLELARSAPRRVRLALRLAEDGWLALRDAVRG